MGLLRIIIGAIIFSAFINFYSYKRFIKKIVFLQPYLSYIRWSLVVVSIVEFVFVLQIRFAFLSIELYMFSAALIAFSLFLFGLSVIYDVLRVLFRRTKFSQNRRKFIKFCFDVTFLILLFSYFFKGLFNALTPPKINFTEIKIKNLKVPFRIAMITDVHIGEFLQKEFLATLVYSINQTKPDVVVIVGDMIDFEADKIGSFLDPLDELRSTYGTFYVPGNHEYYHGIDGIMDKISSHNVTILGNKNVQIGGVNLAGVYDLAGFRFKHLEPNLDAALKNMDKNLPTILLSHQPKFIKQYDAELSKKGVDLVLCGHTHGGQIFPFQILVWLDQHYLRGLYKHNDKMQVYVSSGAGFWGPPVRIMAPSEIAILNLIGE
ncbi:metallophosphoesterase [Campylobacter sp. faydin G-140]|uniref:metallophosphoesterase n=1 Tax=Campylobacter anatolicus TaxID=2829105 RepID=UPI001B9EA1C1|nr:metallophosphoesterase [Campylobacter anatolicus]MBR8465684.1 metallophosphoesterase [Campylobacter anatolicus]